MGLFAPMVDVTHKPYCGPTAVAALTGVPLSHAEKMIRRCRRDGYRDANGRKIPIKGTYTWEVTKVLQRLGCKVTELKNPESTFGRFCQDTAHINAAFLVEVTGHFIAAHKGTLCDTGNLSPVPVEGYRRATRRVKRAWRVDVPEKLSYSAPAEKPPKEKKPKPGIRGVRAARIAARLKAWETRLKRAQTMVKKLRVQAKYYGLKVDLRESGVAFREATPFCYLKDLACLPKNLAVRV